MIDYGISRSQQINERMNWIAIKNEMESSFLFLQVLNPSLLLLLLLLPSPFFASIWDLEDDDFLDGW